MQEEEKKSFPETFRDMRMTPWLLGAGSAVLVLAVLGILSAYVFPYRWGVTQKVRAVLPFPAVMVEYGTAATSRDIARDLASIRRFYENQDFGSMGLRVDFTTEDGKKRLKIREREIVNKMAEDEAIRILAARQGVTVTDDQAAAEVAKRMQEVGGNESDVKDRLFRLYGWGLRDFREKVVIPSMLEESLRTSFAADASQFVSAKAKIESAAHALADGKDFSAVASEFSEGRTATDGGALGWFIYGDLIAPLQEAAKTQKVGIPGAALESDLGFHILQVDERKTENGKDLVRVSQIFTKKKTFGDWLSEQMTGLHVRVLLPEYVWDRDASRVEFKDSLLRQYETEILKKSEGDASLLY